MSETLQEFSVVCRSDIVICDPGDDVVLSCHLQPTISAASMEIKWQNKSDLVCHYKGGEVIVSRGYEGRVTLSLQDLYRGNVSLTLRDVRAEQRGIYICKVIHEGQTIKQYVFLHVNSENFKLVTSPTISAYPGEDVILPVFSSPETSAVSMKIKWFRETELIYQYYYGQETVYENRVDLSTQRLQRGNLSLILRNVQLSDSGEYTCKVFHDGNLKTANLHLKVGDIRVSGRQVDNEIQQQKLNEAPTFVQEALDHDDRTTWRKKKKPSNSLFRRKHSADGIRPNLEYEHTLETHRMEEEREYRHFTPLYVERESSSPNTSLTRAINLSMGKETPFLAASSQVRLISTTELDISPAAATLQQENEGATKKGTRAWRQKKVTKEKQISLSDLRKTTSTQSLGRVPKEHQKRLDDCQIM